MSCVSIGLYHAGIGMGYIYLMMGVIISPGVIAATMTLVWKDMNLLAAALAPILGLCCSVTAWLVTASQVCGGLTVSCTGSNYPMLAGNVVGLLSPLIWIPMFTYIIGRPQNYDWVSMKTIGKASVDQSESISTDPEMTPPTERPDDEKENTAHLNRAAKISRWMTVAMALVFLVVWPLPIFGSGYVFSKAFFTGWVVVGFIWLSCSTACVGVYPLWESRKTLVYIAKSILREIMGKGRPMGSAQVFESVAGPDESDQVGEMGERGEKPL